MALDAIRDEKFLVLPHPQVLDMYRQKGADYDRWSRECVVTRPYSKTRSSGSAVMQITIDGKRD
ncbi:Putative short chain dehydrogenase/reductase [Mycobacteroides abscessus]|nr:Putative short chain dehydrogenase/reductase [Mycobacteroides abscessus]